MNAPHRHLDTLFPETLHVSAADMVELVRRVGLGACLAGVADGIEADFLRWDDFDKSARLACHSRDGVIELMPIADAHQFSFKYVNGHPKNTRAGLPTVESNAAFDADLRRRDAHWGLRMLEDVAACAAGRGLDLDEVVEMPANNLSLVFRRRA